MKHIQESLEHYRDFKFFSLLEQNDKERKKLFRKNPKKEEDEKLAAQANRDVHEIIKKITENYKRMKSAGGGKIEVYKEFWDSQLKAKEALLKKDPGVKLVYNMYDSDYLVVGTVEAENAFVIVLKKDGAEGENPISKISSKEGYEAFKNVTLGVQKDLQMAKDAYVKNVENKKREEEERQRREKLDGFLKEEKEEKKKNKINEQRSFEFNINSLIETAKNFNVNITHQTENLLILQPLDFEAAFNLGSDEWFDKYAEPYWKNYTQHNACYFIYDFTKLPTNKESMIMVLITPEGDAKSCSFKDGSYGSIKYISDLFGGTKNENKGLNVDEYTDPEYDDDEEFKEGDNMLPGPNDL